MRQICQHSFHEAMKTLINDHREVVREMTEGIVLCNPNIKRIKKWNVIVRSDCNEPEV